MREAESDEITEGIRRTRRERNSKGEKKMKKWNLDACTVGFDRQQGGEGGYMCSESEIYGCENGMSR